jgi:hexokinase
MAVGRSATCLLTVLPITGLEKDDGASIRMIPSYVTALPSGSENTVIYALDIGGSNLRVLRNRLSGDGQVSQEKVLKKVIPQHIQTGT